MRHTRTHTSTMVRAIPRGTMNTAKNRRVHLAQLEQVGRHRSYATLVTYIEERDLFEDNAWNGRPTHCPAPLSAQLAAVARGASVTRSPPAIMPDRHLRAGTGCGVAPRHISLFLFLGTESIAAAVSGLTLSDHTSAFTTTPLN